MVHCDTPLKSLLPSAFPASPPLVVFNTAARRSLSTSTSGRVTPRDKTLHASGSFRGKAAVLPRPTGPHGTRSPAPPGRAFLCPWSVGGRTSPAENTPRSRGSAREQVRPGGSPQASRKRPARDRCSGARARGATRSERLGLRSHARAWLSWRCTHELKHKC